MPLYRILHTSTFRHATPVMAAWQVLHLHPRAERNQECLDYDLDVIPKPSDLDARQDFFGNTLHVFSLREPHRELTITSTSLVRRGEPVVPMAGLTPTVSRCRELIRDSVDSGEFELEQFRYASPLIPLDRELQSMIDGLDTDDPPILTWLMRLGTIFLEQFIFDTTATTISTPLSEVMANRRGVCQDFAHLFIACARYYGFPAAYVSGYLLTQPPAGQERLLGADASHAWVSIYVPGTGWIDYDPTNHRCVGSSHVVIARGRDYSDVPPTRGIFSGGGKHVLVVGVTMEPSDHPIVGNIEPPPMGVSQ